MFYRAFSGVMNWFGVDLPGNLVDGLIAGLNRLWPNLMASIERLAAKLPDPVRKALGIKSPSRVFASLGDDTMAGLQRGLQRSQGGPLNAVLGVGQAMAKAGALALGIGGAGQAVAIDSRLPISAAGGPSVVVQGDTLHIQLSAPAGADLAQIEQLFNRLLDQRERHKAARVRSALSDYD